MANADRPNGFVFAKSLTGHAPNGMIRRYEASDRSSDTTNNHGDIYVGDPVKFSSGKVLPANSGDTVLGVAVAVGKDSADHGQSGPYNADNLEQRHLAYDEDGYVYVMPAEGNLFEVQTAADLDLVPGSTADISTDAGESHGSRTTGLSSCELVTVVNTDVEVVEDSEDPENDTTLTNARHLVQFTSTQHAQ